MHIKGAFLIFLFSSANAFIFKSVGRIVTPDDGGPPPPRFPPLSSTTITSTTTTSLPPVSFFPIQTPYIPPPTPPIPSFTSSTPIPSSNPPLPTISPNPTDPPSTAAPPITPIPIPSSSNPPLPTISSNPTDPPSTDPPPTTPIPIPSDPTIIPPPPPSIQPETPPTETTPNSTMEELNNQVEIFEQKCTEYTMSSTMNSSKIQLFVVGGTNAEPNEFPHMAALGFGEEPNIQWLCGGSLISPNYVLTAAHCLSTHNGQVTWAKLGTNNIEENGPNIIQTRVIQRTPHPSYQPPSQYNDIALLKLETLIPFSNFIKPVCLSTVSIEQEALIAVGWGRIEPGGPVSSELKKVDLKYYDPATCQESYKDVPENQLPNGIVSSMQICAGSSERKDTCQGDSGGPLHVQKKGQYFVIGVTSSGLGCAKPDIPGIYTNVAQYIPWIEEIVWKSR